MVRAIMIVEMAGRPAEHLKEMLEKHVGILNQVTDVEVHSIKVNDPKVIELPEGKKFPEGEEMYTTFAECDFELPTLARLTETMFDFMPSSIEVIEPAAVSLDVYEATNLMNNISGRMHRYDEIAKIAHAKLKQYEALIKKQDEEIKKLKGSSKKKASKKSKK
jgi:hypothetical protein